jgi:hypothetical protein
VFRIVVPTCQLTKEKELIVKASKKQKAKAAKVAK